MNFEKKYFEQYTDVPAARIYGPGEHVFFIWYHYEGSSEKFTSGRVDVPKGYQIIEIENYTERDGRGAQTNGVDVWYSNTETVQVEPVYKNEIRIDYRGQGYYDYANFGEVIELDETIDTNKTLTK